jgi:hypothetical protein
MIHAAAAAQPLSRTWNLPQYASNYVNITQSGERVIGGTAAPAGWYPYAARLQIVFSYQLRTTFTCGASLISPNTLLTAAHCICNSIEYWINNQPENFNTSQLPADGELTILASVGNLVAFQDGQINDNIQIVPRACDPVNKPHLVAGRDCGYIRYPGYISQQFGTGMRGDVALIFLPSPVDTSHGIRTAFLDLYNSSNSVGFGHIQKGFTTQVWGGFAPSGPQWGQGAAPPMTPALKCS